MNYSKQEEIQVGDHITNMIEKDKDLGIPIDILLT